VEAKKVRTRKMIRELRTLGYRVELLQAPSSSPGMIGGFSTLVDPRSGVNGHRVVPREILAILLGDRRGGDEQR
jgi:hypothetical protein